MLVAVNDIISLKVKICVNCDMLVSIPRPCNQVFTYFPVEGHI